MFQGTSPESCDLFKPTDLTIDKNKDCEVQESDEGDESDASDSEPDEPNPSNLNGAFRSNANSVNTSVVPKAIDMCYSLDEAINKSKQFIQNTVHDGFEDLG